MNRHFEQPVVPQRDAEDMPKQRALGLASNSLLPEPVIIQSTTQVYASALPI